MIVYFILICFLLLICFIYYNFLCVSPKIDTYENINNYNYNYNNNYILPQKIYSYWDDLENNTIIQSHFNSWRRNIKNWEINIINKNNLKDYVSDDFINKYIELDSTRFSDFLRLELLKTNGGVWLDAGIFVTKNSLFLDKFRNEMINNNYDATLYELQDATIDKDMPYLENWFIMAPKNSKLITDIYYEFNRAFEMGFFKYKKDILIPSKINLTNTLGYEKKTYLMQHAIINYLFKNNKYNINIKNSYDSMFRIHIDHKWDNELIIDNIINKNNNWKDIYAVKLTKGQRFCIYPDIINKYIQQIDLL